MNYKNVYVPTTATLSTGGLLMKGAPMTKMKKSNYEWKFVNMEILKATFQNLKRKENYFSLIKSVKKNE